MEPIVPYSYSSVLFTSNVLFQQPDILSELVAWIYTEKFKALPTAEHYLREHRKTAIQMMFDFFSKGREMEQIENDGQKVLLIVESLNERFKTNFVQKAEDPKMPEEQLALSAPDPLPTIFFTGKTILETEP